MFLIYRNIYIYRVDEDRIGYVPFDVCHILSIWFILCCWQLSKYAYIYCCLHPCQLQELIDIMDRLKIPAESFPERATPTGWVSACSCRIQLTIPPSPTLVCWGNDPKFAQRLRSPRLWLTSYLGVRSTGDDQHGATCCFVLLSFFVLMLNWCFGMLFILYKCSFFVVVGILLYVVNVVVWCCV